MKRNAGARSSAPPRSQVTEETLFDAQRLRRWAIAPVKRRFTRNDTMLYALGLGLGGDRCSADELRFVYERGLQALPSFGTVLAYPFLWYAEPGTGVDLLHVVHAEMGFQNHAALPVEGEVIGRTQVTAVRDKGAQVGALLVTECTVRDAASGALLCTLQSSSLARKLGGFDPKGLERGSAPEPWPEREPDAVFEMPTLPQQALIFRLSGDWNPLHADPERARAAGHPRPLLHGRCTFGMAAWALQRTLCGGHAARLTAMHARMSGPVYPGETLRTEAWRSGSQIRFRTRVPARQATVLSQGTALITPEHSSTVTRRQTA